MAVEARGVAPEPSEEGGIVGVRACTPEAGFWGVDIGVAVEAAMVGNQVSTIQYIKAKIASKSEDTGEILSSKINIPNPYPEQKIWISCLLI